MGMSLQIAFRHMEPSPAVEARVRKLAAELERLDERITSCRVVIEAPPKHRHKGGPYAIRIEASAPGADIHVDSERDLHAEHTDVYVALRDAFRAARRQVDHHVRVRRGDVKHHEPATQTGSVTELDPSEGFGRIETDDGHLVYFHRNSVHDTEFEFLVVGTRVRFEQEAGEEGPQAVSVRPAAS